MTVEWFFSSLYFYILESIIESLLVFTIVWLVVRLARIDDSAVRLRFYLLPLVIPGFLSPLAHVLVPRIQESALIVQFERYVFPVATLAFQSREEFAPFVLVVLGILLSISLARWGVCVLRQRAWLLEHRVEDAAMYQRATRILASLAPRFAMPCPALVLTRYSRIPFAWQTTQARVLMPRDLVEQLDDEELEVVLAHELAHLKRGDSWSTLLARLVRDVMFFNPLAHWIHRALGLLREEACDDLAVGITDKPLALASSLLKAWRGQNETHTLAWGPALLSSRTDLERRVMRLLTMSGHPPRRQQFDFVFSCVATLLTLALSIV